MNRKTLVGAVATVLAVAWGVSVYAGCCPFSDDPRPVADVVLTKVSPIQLVGTVPSVEYWNGSVKWGNRFDNLNFTFDKVNNDVRATVSFDTRSDGWFTQAGSIAMIVHFLDASGTDLGAMQVGTAVMPHPADGKCPPENHTNSGLKPNLGAAFERINAIRIVPHEWAQTVDAC